MGDLRLFVLTRDRWTCMAARVDRHHVCEGRWAGQAFKPVTDLTLQHVVGVHGPADIRRDNDAHCVTLCYRLNGGGSAPSSEVQEASRVLLRKLHPVCTG